MLVIYNTSHLETPTRLSINWYQTLQEVKMANDDDQTLLNMEMT